MMKKLKKLGLSLLVLAFLVPLYPGNNASALSCMAIPPVEEAYDNYDAVIKGYVEEISSSEWHNLLKVTVLESYKEIDTAQITVQEDNVWGTSVAGEEYLYFLNVKGDNWENPLCSPSSLATDAEEEIEYLQKQGIVFSNDAADQVNTGDDAGSDEQSVKPYKNNIWKSFAFFFSNWFNSFLKSGR